MLSCKELAQHQASDYIDKQLTFRQRFGVQVHLVLCDHCRRFIKQLKLVKKVLQARTASVMDESQVKSLADRLAAAHRDQKKSSPPL